METKELNEHFVDITQGAKDSQIMINAIHDLETNETYISLTREMSPTNLIILTGFIVGALVKDYGIPVEQVLKAIDGVTKIAKKSGEFTTSPMRSNMS